MKKQELIVFEVWGKQAHYRDESSNVTSKTYPFMPRTAVVGLLGDISGHEKDCAEVFSPDKCDIAIELMSENTTELSLAQHLSSEVDQSLVRVEHLYAKNPLDSVRFRIYMRHEDEALMNELKELVRMRLFNRGLPKLGKRYCHGDMEVVGIVYDYDMVRPHTARIHSVFNKDIISGCDMEEILDEEILYTRHRVARTMDGVRKVTQRANYIVPLNQKGFIATGLKEDVVKLSFEGTEKLIAWL